MIEIATIQASENGFVVHWKTCVLWGKPEPPQAFKRIADATARGAQDTESEAWKGEGASDEKAAALRDVLTGIHEAQMAMQPARGLIVPKSVFVATLGEIGPLLEEAATQARAIEDLVLHGAQLQNLCAPPH